MERSTQDGDIFAQQRFPTRWELRGSACAEVVKVSQLTTIDLCTNSGQPFVCALFAAEEALGVGHTTASSGGGRVSGAFWRQQKTSRNSNDFSRRRRRDATRASTPTKLSSEWRIQHRLVDSLSEGAEEHTFGSTSLLGIDPIRLNIQEQESM